MFLIGGHQLIACLKGSQSLLKKNGEIIIPRNWEGKNHEHNGRLTAKNFAFFSKTKNYGKTGTRKKGNILTVCFTLVSHRKTKTTSFFS